MFEKNGYESFTRDELVNMINKQKEIIDDMNKKTITLDYILQETRGNQTKAAMLVNANRGSVRKYIDNKTINRVHVHDDGTMQILVPPKYNQKKGARKC